MSSNGPSNGKKSSNSSGVNTPASTPVGNGSAVHTSAQSSPPPNNAPKYGTLVPNRIFVGGISASTTEGELMQLFSAYGTVKAAKIIQDRAGVSKGYGFITFETEDDARRPLCDSDNIVLRERKLNIAPAIKKQPFGVRAPPPPFDGVSGPPAPGASPAPAHPPPFFFPPAAAPYFQAYYTPPPPPPPHQGAQGPTAQEQHAAQQAQQAQSVYQGPPVYPGQTGHPQAAAYPSMMFPQTIYMPQQYPMAMPFDYTVYGGGGGGGGVPPGPPPAAFGQCQPGGGGSPSRPCYTNPYGPASGGPPEALFYSPMPVFHPGAPLDPAHAAVYAAEAFDMGPPIAQYEEVIMNGFDAAQTAPPSSPERNAATPVVSLLSIDKHQEKDYAAMQGGRRPSPRKPPQPNGYHHHHHHQHLQQQQQQPQSFLVYNGGGRPQNGTVSRGGGAPPTSSRRRPLVTSVERSASNNSPSSPDEQHHHQRKGTPPPPRPPAPYSPSGRRGSSARPSYTYHNHSSQMVPPPQPPSSVSFNPARRPQRKTTSRRCPAAAAQYSEIGAGDAPLPPPVSCDDVVAQVDALKI
ncbi:trithorax group protein osa-like [Cylas formicarius]|uniref:trithorax group protein osa-like n=1 Tax=Cylas formicarius TaxID=197179 RepID=UPI0029585BA2|nr:trithorax group protein osa-like [Cylas formicarius]XP_060532627.1 trithorax group protein osa-like [Cylas formicarius]XP_060532628.1 trithorax group protein osa-like [Cylas formicarius]XP_060532629.1 trithorax group protein osa-like [Cylas formicarius]XP_060532630.1 trithorax group protein osa-like [Cylas formicarius]